METIKEIAKLWYKKNELAKAIRKKIAKLSRDDKELYKEQISKYTK